MIINAGKEYSIKDAKKTFSDYFFGLRTKKGLLLKDAAENIGVNATTLSTLENASFKSLPADYILEKICDFYNIDFSNISKNAKIIAESNKKNRGKKNYFGIFLQNLRIDKKLKIREVADLTGISDCYLGSLEKPGRCKTPSKEILHRIASFYGIDVSKLISALNEDEKFTDKDEECKYFTCKYLPPMNRNEYQDVTLSALKGDLASFIRWLRLESGHKINALVTAIHVAKNTNMSETTLHVLETKRNLNPKKLKEGRLKNLSIYYNIDLGIFYNKDKRIEFIKKALKDLNLDLSNIEESTKKEVTKKLDTSVPTEPKKIEIPLVNNKGSFEIEIIIRGV